MVATYHVQLSHSLPFAAAQLSDVNELPCIALKLSRHVELFA